MSRKQPVPTTVEPLSIEQLEAGLQFLDSIGADASLFWSEHVESFRKTLLFAIWETSEALLSRDLPSYWRNQFETDLEALVSYLGLSNRYIERQLSRERPAVALRRRAQLH